VEADVENPDDPADGGGVLHECVLQADLLLPHEVVEGGGGPGLGEHRN